MVSLLDDAGEKLLTRRENASEVPNYYVRTRGEAGRAITTFPDPAPQFAGVRGELITYQRADGVQLSGTLYLPANYDAARNGPLPTLLWAYPAEFTDARVASQVVDETNRFVRPGGISHLFMLTQGYAVLDNPSMPIVGANGAEPNDTYVQQLSASAQAAVDELVRRGCRDRRCIARWRAFLWRVHDGEPAGAHRPLPRRHRALGRLQPHADAVRIPGRAAAVLASG